MDTYEKKYNEALEQAKKELATCGSMNCDAARFIFRLFPQLRESEEETTRKELLDFVRSFWEDHKEKLPQTSRWVAWLEKQKEQKPVEKLPKEEYVKKFKALCDAYEIKLPNREYDIYHLCKDLHKLFGDVDVQKPAECIEDSVKFEEGFKTGRESGLRDGQKYVLDNAESYGLCKPAEWSEEDERILTGIIERGSVQVPPYTTALREEQIEWLMNRLKSLRPQPREEIYHAAKHDLAIRFMNYLDENRPEGKMDLSNGECEDIDKAFKESDWAKIMRYVEKYSPSWKPSEEQMEALKGALETYNGFEEYDAMKSLQNDLKTKL